MARAYCKTAATSSSAPDDLTQPPLPQPPSNSSTSTSNTSPGASATQGSSSGSVNGIRVRTPLPAILPCSRNLHHSLSVSDQKSDASANMNEDDENNNNDDDDDDDDFNDGNDDFSDVVEDTIYAYEERFLRQMRREWMNSVAILMRRQGLLDDHTDLVFSYILPYYKQHNRRSF